jgi:D-xylose reductase
VKSGYDLDKSTDADDRTSSWVELDVPTVKQVESLFSHSVVTDIAKRVNHDPAAVLLRWATQRGFIVIPKSVKPERMAENLRCTEFDLSEEDIEEISKLDRGFRFGNPKAFDPRLSIFA